MEAHIAGSTVELIHGDITDQAVDVLVSDANQRLSGVGGLASAIHKRGGPTIADEACRKYPKGCPPGEVAVTSAGRLQARFLFHAVGPIYENGSADEVNLLASTYRRCLELAIENECQTVALPPISAGVSRYPVNEAAAIAIETVNEFLQDVPTPLTVKFVIEDARTMRVFVNTLLGVVTPAS